MVKFGPSGMPDIFFEEGYSSTLQIPAWLASLGLDIYEYSFGRGVQMSSQTAAALGEAFAAHDIEISVHAPYYINFASNEDEKVLKSTEYVMQSLKKLKIMGGKRCVVHVGSESGQSRGDALKKVLDGISHTLTVAYAAAYDDLIICPETMGKMGQIGSVDEILEICRMDKMLYPCFDFGHINAREGGSLKTEDDFKRIVDKCFDALGEEKTVNMHVHFSKIQYGDKGEIRHVNFDDMLWGPDFEPFAKVILDLKLSPYILCESRGKQAEDAKLMKDYYLSLVR
jgi:deoxyribonuclease-4